MKDGEEEKREWKVRDNTKKDIRNEVRNGGRRGGGEEKIRSSITAIKPKEGRTKQSRERRKRREL